MRRVTIAFALGCLVACGGAEEANLFTSDGGSGADATSSDDSGSGSDAGASDGGTRTDGGGGDAGNRDLACGQKATNRECADCCAKLYPAGAQFAINAQIQCACQGSRCGSVCQETLCAVPPKAPDAGSPCASCVRSTLTPDAGSKDCIGPVTTACANNADCSAYENCANTQCKGKP